MGCPECETTRAALAEAEHKLEAMVQFRGVRSVQEFTAERDKALRALAVAQAEAAEMRAALTDAVSALDALMGDSDIEGDDSPEFVACQRGNAILSRPPGSDAALRALLERAALDTVRACEMCLDDDELEPGTVFAVDGGAIVDRLLPATPRQEGGEG